MELGSEYDLNLNDLNIKKENFFQHFQKENYFLYNSGRNAIRAIAIKNGQVLLPEFICESVIKCFDKDEVVFYKINEDFSINQNDLLNKVTQATVAVLVVHYFGQFTELTELKSSIKSINPNISFIEDLTQSLFSYYKLIGDYSVASIRKWFPIPHGGMLINPPANQNDIHVPSCQDNTKAYAMTLKNLYLCNILDCNKEYRTIFTNCEHNLDVNSNIEKISDFSKFILGCQNIPSVIKARKSNYSYLNSKLTQLGLRSAINLGENDCPFAFIIRIPNRDNLRSFLIRNNIYCAVHWPFDDFKASERTTGIKNSNELLSLPIDQRYSTKELDYLVTTLSKYGGDLSF